MRGFRIELGEIEAALAAYAGVREAAVALRQDPPAGERLVAYVVPEAGAEIHLAELRAHLVARLPEYMLPAAIVLLPALPLTAHGKLDRRALPAPERDAAAAAYAPPCTEAERLLAGLWAEQLGVERVGRDDSFFELGGHSLLATRLFARLRRTLGMDLPLAALFEEPTLSQFAARVEAALPGLGLAGLGSEFNAPFNAAARAAGEPVEPSFYGAAERVPDPAGDFPLAYNQRALWFIERLAPGNAAYHIAGIARLLGPVDTAALYRALAALVDRHPALRTTFHDAEDGPLQRVCPQPEPAFDFRDERDENAATGDEDALAARLREEVRRPFDLERGPLLRLALFRQAGGERILLLAVHHLVADFFSLGVMLRDLGALYAAEVTGQPARLAWPAATYEQKVRREQALLAGPDGERLWEHWRDRLAGCPLSLELPVDRPRPRVQTYGGASWRLRLGADPSSALARLAAARSATPFMALLALFQALLGRWSGQRDFAVGVPTSGRDGRGAEDLSEVVGYFVNPVAMRAELVGDPCLDDLLDRSRNSALAAFEHADFPLPLLAERLQPERDPARSPIFQVMFHLEKGRRLEEAALAAFTLAGVRLALGGPGGLEIESLPLPATSSQFDLTLGLVEDERGFAGRWIYRTDLFDAATVGRLAGHFETLLAGLTADPQAPLSSLPLLAPAERHQALVEWNAPLPDYACEDLLPGLIAARVAAIRSGWPWRPRKGA